MEGKMKMHTKPDEPGSPGRAANGLNCGTNSPAPLGPFFKMNPRKPCGRPIGVKVWGIGIGA